VQYLRVTFKYGKIEIFWNPELISLVKTNLIWYHVTIEARKWKVVEKE